MDLERVRKAWTCAAGFPPDKESVYPDHARAQQFDHHKGKTVLEYGCGGGADAMSYLRRGCYVYFADVVPWNVATASTRIAKCGLAEKARAVHLRKSSEIPLDAESVDVISSHGVLHHIEDPAPVLDEFFRILRPRGHLYVMLYTETLRARADSFVRTFVERGQLSEAEAFCWFTDGQGTPYARPYTEQEGFDFLKAGGFKPVGRPVVYNNGDFRTFKAVRP